MAMCALNEGKGMKLKMKYFYEKKYEIGFSHLDSNFNLSVISALDFVEDMMTEYLGTMKSDNLYLRQYCQALWVVTKTKICFCKKIQWRDVLFAKSSIVGMKSIRIELETEFRDKCNEIVFIAKQELCPIDYINRKIRRIQTISFPSDLECTASSMPEPTDFQHIKNDIPMDLVQQVRVLYTEVDHNGHTNNVSYIRYILNTMDSAFYEKHEIKELEIHYLKESMEENTLDVYKAVDSGNYIYQIQKEGQCIVEAIWKTEE